MARIPLSFYLNILAGILVIFNHYASSETGDFALDKVTGAAGRFYDLFRDTAVTFQHNCAWRLETALCGPVVNNLLIPGAAEYVRLHYCLAPVQDWESADLASDEREPHGGYGDSDVAFVYYQPRAQLLEPWTSVEGRSGQTPTNISRAVWDWSCGVVVVIGGFLLRVWASSSWFTVPLRVTGVLLATYSVVSVLGYFLGANAVLRFVSEVYLAVVVDFFQCIQWEAQRHAWDVGVVMMEYVYGTVVHP